MNTLAEIAVDLLIVAFFAALGAGVNHLNRQSCEAHDEAHSSAEACR
jgi:hypothetical protein